MDSYHMRRRGRSKNMFNGVSIFYLKFTISTASMDLYKKKTVQKYQCYIKVCQTCIFSPKDSLLEIIFKFQLELLELCKNACWWNRNKHLHIRCLNQLIIKTSKLRNGSVLVFEMRVNKLACLLENIRYWKTRMLYCENP